MTTSDLNYLLGYAYGYSNHQLPPKNFVEIAFYEGLEDGRGDISIGVRPLVDFNCKEHCKRDFGTLITAIRNPYEMYNGAPYHVYVYALGSYTGDGMEVYCLTDKPGFATSDRTWVRRT